MIEDLARGFSCKYIDAEDTVGGTVSELREYIDLYASNPGRWVSQSTSLVTSSMMVKVDI
jgi:hypothetical protein